MVLAVSLVVAVAAHGLGGRGSARLEIAQVTLRDGSTLVAGKTFRVDVKLANRGTRPLRIWDASSVEGLQCFSAALKRDPGQANMLKPVPPLRAGGVPSLASIEAGGSLVVRLDLAQWKWPAGIPPGAYDLVFSYRNDTRMDGRFGPAWTGVVSSKAVKVQVLVH